MAELRSCGLYAAITVFCMLVVGTPAAGYAQGKVALQAMADELNDACRGGSGDDPKTMRACEQRDAVMSKLEESGVCWGREGQAGHQKTWGPCDRRSTQRAEQALPKAHGAGAGQTRPVLAFAMVGTERIDLPGPKGMVSAKDAPEIYVVFNTGLRPGDRLAAAFVVPAELDELRQGRRAHLSRYALVRVISGADSVSLNSVDWAAAKVEMKRIFPAIVKPASGYESRVREIGDQLSEVLRDPSFTVRLNQLTSLGVIGETADSLSVGQIGKVSAASNSGTDTYHSLRIATTLRVGKRTILLESFSEINATSKAALTSALASANGWQELVLQANRVAERSNRPAQTMGLESGAKPVVVADASASLESSAAQSSARTPARIGAQGASDKAGVWSVLQTIRIDPRQQTLTDRLRAGPKEVPPLGWTYEAHRDDFESGLASQVDRDYLRATVSGPESWKAAKVQLAQFKRFDEIYERAEPWERFLGKSVAYLFDPVLLGGIALLLGSCYLIFRKSPDRRTVNKADTRVRNFGLPAESRTEPVLHERGRMSPTDSDQSGSGGKGRKSALDEALLLATPLIVDGYRRAANAQGCAPSNKTTDERLIEIYQSVAVAFRAVAAKRNEQISALQLNSIAWKFMQVDESLGREMFAKHLAYETNKYQTDGLRPDYRKEMRLF